jgi:hypothetical protein
MGLKAPHIFTFLASMIIVIMVLMVKFAGAEVPYLARNEFWAMLFAYLLLAGGSLTRSL